MHCWIILKFYIFTYFILKFIKLMLKFHLFVTHMKALSLSILVILIFFKYACKAFQVDIIVKTICWLRSVLNIVNIAITYYLFCMNFDVRIITRIGYGGFEIETQLGLLAIEHSLTSLEYSLKYIFGTLHCTCLMFC